MAGLAGLLATKNVPLLQGRDVFNEKPPEEEGLTGPEEVARAALPSAAVLHTSKGDITVRLHNEAVPKTVENFTTHAKNGYYDNVIFHRVIKDFMIQTGAASSAPRMKSFKAEVVLTSVHASVTSFFLSFFFSHG
jgi:hypothetical protein